MLPIYTTKGRVMTLMVDLLTNPKASCALWTARPVTNLTRRCTQIFRWMDTCRECAQQVGSKKQSTRSRALWIPTKHRTKTSKTDSSKGARTSQRGMTTTTTRRWASRKYRGLIWSRRIWISRGHLVREPIAGPCNEWAVAPSTSKTIITIPTRNRSRLTKAQVIPVASMELSPVNPSRATSRTIQASSTTFRESKGRVRILPMNSSNVSKVVNLWWTKKVTLESWSEPISPSKK